ncbi:FitA-like ribbon-helix-helix domain-containing protein [Sandarakinorhabdus sp.]|uniref:FitA-like ribbon-helix-helix domain-containing protein n=1 Tax=Sandarakinorhabdus sp. TaxID=1916663 RepID=UPI003F6EC9F3
MATLMVRNVPEEAKHRFRQVAAAHGRSMEEHLRQLIIEADVGSVPSAVSDAAPVFRPFPVDAQAASRARIERLIALGRGLEDFELPPRETGTIKDVDFA